ncbi:MAG: hypothetical protein QOE70_67 [Chthoniobacter sp.]|jgi:hypothetical protein|nr:hypothetical protein [Chthoniobacter sp.]
MRKVSFLRLVWIIKLARPLVFLLALAPLAFAADAPRVAIVAEPSATAAAELLTVELSRQPITLLERAEIDRVLSEQRLSVAGFTAGRLPQLGALLGADGLIFLGTEKVGGNEVLAARLVAVHPGVIIGAWQESAPPADLAAWSRETASAITTLLPKLKVTREAAIAVSVVNLRATRARPEAAGIESETALLLIHRLAHEPAFFVLERQQMAALLAEQREELDAFWTGCYLVDGAIEQGLTEPDQLTIRLRLQPPDGGEAVPMVHTCRRTELVEAAEFLAREIARQLRREPTAAKWNATQEAEQFWRDAQWAFRNELFARAATAAESSWALGRRNADTLTLRIRAELLAARPELVLPYRYPKDYQYLRGYLTERNWQWRAQIPFTRGYRTPDVLAKIFTEMPEAERQSRLARTQRALELFRDHFDELFAEPRQTPLAAEMLTIGGAMLEWFHDNRSAWDDDVRRLASLLREVDDLASRRVREFGKRAGQKPPPLFWQSKVALTPLWAADPARTLATFRAALREPFDAEDGATMRITMVHSRDLFPDLTAAGNRAQTPKLWSSFVKELLASDFPGDRWTGLCLQYEAASEDSQEAMAIRLRDDFWAERARFARQELPYDYFELLRLPRGGHVNSHNLRNPSPARESPDLAFPRQFLLYLLAASTPIDRDSFWELFHPETYTAGQAAELLAAMLAHETRVRAKLGDHWVLNVIRERSQEMLLRFPKLRPEAAPDGVLKVTRYWHPYRLPQFRDGVLKAADLSFKEAIYRDGRLWVFATFEGAERGHDVKRPQFIFGIDLKTFDTEVIAFEEPPPLAEPRKDSWGGANLEVSPDAIFVSKAWQLSRYDRRAKTWRHFTELPGVWEQPWLIGGRLYVRINNSPGAIQVQHFGEMVELDPQTGAPTLLVSDRRSPSASPLDTWPLSWLTAQPGADGRVLFRGIAGDGSSRRRYAAYDAAARRWDPLDETAWKQSTGGSAAHMAMASGESAWKVEGRGGGRDTLSLASGKHRIAFRCELNTEDRALLARNGANPPFDIIEQNLMPGQGVAPLGYETPDGIAISQVFRMPGFWFVPKSSVETATNAETPRVRR